VDIIKEIQLKCNPSIFNKNICKLGEEYGKGAGEWFSDFHMASIFKQLNKELDPLGDMEIITFQEVTIYQKDILDNCFEKDKNKEFDK